jgi:hypothetical protein
LGLERAYTGRLPGKMGVRLTVQATMICCPTI